MFELRGSGFGDKLDAFCEYGCGVHDESLQGNHEMIGGRELWRMNRVFGMKRNGCFTRSPVSC